jgi:hypothetical protein
MTFRNAPIVVLLASLSCAVGHAEQSKLFNARESESTSVPVRTYSKTTASLKAGDVVSFSNNESVEIGELLGKGTRTIVYGIKDEPSRALRLPMLSDFSTLKRSRLALDLYAIGASYLQNYRAPVPNVLYGLESEYLVVDRFPKEAFNLAQFVQHEIPASAEVREKAFVALVEFAQKTAAIRNVGDGRAEQFVYLANDNKWVLLDWATPIRSAFVRDAEGQIMTHSSPNTIVTAAIQDLSPSAYREQMLRLPSSQIRSAVQLERKRILNEQPEWASQLVALDETPREKMWPAAVQRQTPKISKIGMPVPDCPNEFSKLKK